VDSRHLGPIALEGGVGGGWMNTTVEIAGSSVPFRLEIDFPSKFDEGVVRKIDLALDALPDLEGLARQTIETAAERPGSAPALMFELWGATSIEEPRIEDFLRQLRATQITMLPDGGPGSLDRIVLAYRLEHSPTSGTATVRFREGIGAELDPAPRVFS